MLSVIVLSNRVSLGTIDHEQKALLSSPTHETLILRLEQAYEHVLKVQLMHALSASLLVCEMHQDVCCQLQHGMRVRKVGQGTRVLHSGC